MTLKQKLLWTAVGVLLGYMGSRILDNVPVIKNLPKIRGF